MKKNLKGSMIVYALGVISFVVILLYGTVKLVASQAKNARDIFAREMAFQIAESCSQEYRWYLAHNTDGKTVEEVMDFWDDTVDPPRGKNSAYEWDFLNPEKNAVGRCSALITNFPTSSSQPVIVKFQGWSQNNPNIKKTISVRFRRTSWSDYVVLSNQHANFDNNWDIKGKIMSNTGVHFDGVAHNRVYAGSSSYFDPDLSATKPGVWSSQPIQSGCEYNTTKNSCVFLGGKRYPIPQKDFNGIAVDLNAMKNFAQRPSGTTVDACNYSGSNNCYFSVPTGKAGKRITLRTDDQFEIVTVKDVKSNSNDIKNEDNSSKQIFPIPQDGIIFVGGTIWVDGKVDGRRVTIVAGEGAGDIYVGSGDLKYTDKENGNDVIGLIAKGNILLTSEKKNCGTSCEDLELDAAMVAKDGKVGKEDFNPSCCGVGCNENKNRIDIFGSIVSNKFIEFTVQKYCNVNTQKKLGFDFKNIEYDNNLYIKPPPFFPSDVYYSVDLWNEL